ncbi:type II toxin-antitoxin system RelE/ParE family toxin [Sorangium sp. So ce1153]|uniref:type II toxin-antitoxin system RelE/ParE family toxin n=1 Tax=Sorangium sp. So ce1153 TaxID=3133333 RepID=UPI003F5ED23A
MRAAIHFSPQSLAQLQAAHTWWKNNRPSSPRLFREELAEALALLRTAPMAGAPYPHRKLRDVRRIVLQKTRYYLYYVVGADGVTVLAVWSALRGRAPRLR